MVTDKGARNGVVAAARFAVVFAFVYVREYVRAVVGSISLLAGNGDALEGEEACEAAADDDRDQRVSGEFEVRPTKMNRAKPD